MNEDENDVLRQLFSGSPEGDPVEAPRPYSMLVEPKDFQDCCGYKYVRFEDGIVLFCDSCDFVASHKKVVQTRPDHKAISAGTIKIKNGKWAIIESGSLSAHLSRKEDDEDYILKVLAPFFTYDIEVSYW